MEGQAKAKSSSKAKAQRAAQVHPHFCCTVTSGHTAMPLTPSRCAAATIARPTPLPRSHMISSASVTAGAP